MKYEETEISNLVLAQILRKLNFVVLKYVNSDDRVKQLLNLSTCKWMGQVGEVAVNSLVNVNEEIFIWCLTISCRITEKSYT